MKEWNFEAWYHRGVVEGYNGTSWGSLGGGYTVIHYVPAPDFKKYPVKPRMVRYEYNVDNEMEAREDCRLLNSLGTIYYGIEKHPYKVGDDVSYGFNGDWYYAGKIDRFTKSGKFFTTDQGYKFSMKVVKDEIALFLDKRLEVFDIQREIFHLVNSPFIAAKGI